MGDLRNFAVTTIACLAAAAGYAQTYPTKPVRIVAGGAGGSSDLSSRLVAPGVSAGLGQQVVVENRPGVIAIETVAKAAPDGYTVLWYGSVIWIEPMLRSDTAWEPRDFAPVTMAVRAPNVLTVHPSLPVKSAADLVALAKAKPGQLNYASVGAGSSTHLAAELFNYSAHVKIVRVPYKAVMGAMSDLLSGQIQVIFASPFSVAQYRQTGRLRALAVTSAEPSPLAPGLPTVAASGVPGYEAGTIEGVFAPAKTPEAYVTRLNQEFVKVLSQPDIKDRFLKSGVEVVASTPGYMSSMMKSEAERLGPVVKAANIRAE